MAYQQPYTYALYKAELLLTLRKWNVEDYRAVLPTITPADVRGFVRCAAASTCTLMSCSHACMQQRCRQLQTLNRNWHATTC